MAKTLVSAPANALLKIAKTKGVGTILSLSEKTGVDRKTLKLINDGKCVKETTIKMVMDALRLPASHLLDHGRPSTLPSDHYASRRSYEAPLQKLNATLLKQMLDQISPDDLVWRLNIDRVSDGIKSKLLKFENLVQEWLPLIHNQEHWKGQTHTLKGQLAKISMSADIENSIADLLSENVTLFGGTFIRWERRGQPSGPYDNYDSIIEFFSIPYVVIAIEPKNATRSMFRVDQTDELPLSFDNQPMPIQAVFVDGSCVWSRSGSTF